VVDRWLNQQPTNQITLQLPVSDWVSFYIAGTWQKPSTSDQDCAVVVSLPNGKAEEYPVMVRLRKNADKLSPQERDRFLKALVRLNQNGTYKDFETIHQSNPNAYLQAHGGSHFLPWHRAFLLDLERELQNIDPSVTLPYWRFDESAPNVFRGSFMGATRQNTRQSPVMFDLSNPMVGWVRGQQVGIVRSASFDTQSGQPARLITQSATLALGTNYLAFANMESNPHGAAHTSFIGPIDNPGTAPQDPLFFLLHTNVDRLWALWQWVNKHTDPNSPNTYIPGPTNVKQLMATMWPWDNILAPLDPSRPNFTAGGTFPASAGTSAPGLKPTIQNMLDFEGRHDIQTRLGFGYDDVPFSFT
jgi:tyrosinase